MSYGLRSIKVSAAKHLWLEPTALGASFITGLIYAAPVAAVSDAPAAARSASGIEEVIVTSQRREERLQDVPVSVSVMTSSQLERSQITNARALVGAIPSLTVTPGNFGRNDVFVGLRGQVATSSLSNIDPSVGLYVNGIYYARTAGANISFIDMERVEVLRGPQGTLFGRNTVGGALNITTKEPTNNLEGSVKLGYGNYNNLTANGVVNVPVIDDRLAVRLVYDHQQHDGYVKGLVQPLVGSKEFSDQNQDYVRATAKAQLSEAVDLLVYGDNFTFRSNSDGSVSNFFDPTAGVAATSVSQPTALIGSSPAIPLISPAARTRFFNGLAAQPALPDGRTTNSEFNPKNKGHAYDLSAQLTVDLGGAVLKSLTAYRNINFHFPNDQDGSNVTVSELYDYYSIGNQFTQELQLSGKDFDDRLTWITGLYFFSEHNDNAFTTASAPPTPVLGSAFAADGSLQPGATLSTSGARNIDNKSESAFAQVTYAMVPRVRVTGGVRYVIDNRSLDYYNYAVNATTGAVLNCGSLGVAGFSTVAGGCTYTPDSLKFHYIPWTVGVDWKPDDNTLIYGKVAQGFRSGGLQQCCGPTTAYYAPFDPEKVRSYEIGTKLSLFDNRLRFGAAAYYTDFTDVLAGVPVFVGTVNVFPTRNAGTAQIKGLELDWAALVGNLRLGGSLGLIDPKYTSGLYEGTSFVNTPKRTFSLNADYPVDVSVGTINFHTDYAYQSFQYFEAPVSTSVAPGVAFGNVFSAAQKSAIAQSGYGLLNAMISLELDKPSVTVSLWGRNLTDKYYFARTNTAVVGAANFYNAALPGDPRTYGITTEMKF